MKYKQPLTTLTWGIIGIAVSLPALGHRTLSLFSYPLLIFSILALFLATYQFIETRKANLL